MFWHRCLDARCVIIPMKVYSQYNAVGGISEEHFVGVRFAAMPVDSDVVGPDYYFLIEGSLADEYPLFATPEEALEEYENRK